MSWLLAVAIAIALFAIRCAYVLVRPKRDAGKRTTPCSTVIVLGSGGHTTEMLHLLSALPLARYTPRTYVIAGVR